MSKKTLAGTQDCLTLAYKHSHNQPTYVDLYPPKLSPESASTTKCPAVVYFHGGSLTVGNRRSWFPDWLHRRVTSSGMVFLSADYTLLAPATGHDIVQDIADLFRYLHSEVNAQLQAHLQTGSSTFPAFEIDTDALAVAGSSAGGMCAYLACMHASPRPKALLSLYGMGGDMLTWMYLAPKTKPFLRGREILDPKDFPEFVYPACQSSPAVSDSPLAYHSPTYRIPNYPANPRMLVGRLYLQMGTFLDYLTGCHEPSLSASLRTILSKDRVLSEDSASTEDLREQCQRAIPTQNLSLFPQFADLSLFPPTLLVHGSDDSAVWMRESTNLCTLLQNAGVHAELKIVDGKEHSFDYEPGAEEEFGGSGGLFDQSMAFLRTHTSS